MKLFMTTVLFWAQIGFDPKFAAARLLVNFLYNHEVFVTASFSNSQVIFFE